MKTMKVIPQLLVAGTMVFGTACSSSNVGAGAGTTSETGTDASSGTSATSGAGSTSATGTSDTGATLGTNNTGTDMRSSSSYPGVAPTGGTAAGAAASTDIATFMASFANMQDPAFMMTAASSNMMEIQMGQLAAQKASNPEVKKFGQMMVDHHTKGNQELKTVATPMGVKMPQTLMPIHQAMADKLMGKTGKDFDESYMDAMETAHKLDIAMFEVKSAAAETPAVKAFATKTLPMLRSHQTMASDLEKKVD